MKPIQDIRGFRSGRLVVVEYAYKSGTRHYWKCACDCGAQIVLPRNHIKSGHTRSCGCLALERIAAQGRSNRKHGEMVGQKGSPEYQCWVDMRRRCENRNHPAYRWYGARGISVCDRWHEFSSFLADMGRRPADDLSLDRTNNDGNYEPTNCTWATRSQQGKNKRPQGRRKRESRRLGSQVSKDGLKHHPRSGENPDDRLETISREVC